MKRTVLVAFALLFVLSGAFAACGLGVTPLSVSSKAIPGQRVKVTWNLYNMYGDRSTHVVLSSTGEDGWAITFEPSLHEATYDVSGAITTINENVAVPNSPAVRLTPSVNTEGYVKHPFNDEYIPVVPVVIYFDVPEDIPLWETHEFTVTATGSCFGGGGTVSTQISQKLDVSIQTINAEYYEEFIWERPWYVTYLPVILTGFVLAIILVLVLLRTKAYKKSFSKKKKKK